MLAAVLPPVGPSWLGRNLVVGNILLVPQLLFVMAKARRGRGKGRGTVTLSEAAFADALAQIASMSLYAAASRDADFWREVRRARKDTRELKKLARSRMPPAVRAWLTEACVRGGPVQEAFASEYAIALRRLHVKGCKPGSRLGRVGVQWPGNGRMDEGPCTPMCFPPIPP